MSEDLMWWVLCKNFWELKRAYFSPRIFSHHLNKFKPLWAFLPSIKKKRKFKRFTMVDFGSTLVPMHSLEVGLRKEKPKLEVSRHHLFTILVQWFRESTRVWKSLAVSRQLLSDFPHLGSWDPSRPCLRKFSQAHCFRYAVALLAEHAACRQN